MLSLLLGVLVLGHLEEPVLLLFYLVHGVDFSQESRVHGGGWKFPFKVFNSIFQRKSCLLPEGITAGQPLNVVGSQES